MKYYTINEIKKHNKANDCWIYSNNNVYNVTNFISKHPGGFNSIIKNSGKDCIKHFNFHSAKGKQEWKKYKIGEIYKSENKSCCVIN